MFLFNIWLDISFKYIWWGEEGCLHIIYFAKYFNYCFRYLIVTDTHLYILRTNKQKKGYAHIVATHLLSSIVKITSKRRFPEWITFSYGTFYFLNILLLMLTLCVYWILVLWFQLIKFKWQTVINYFISDTLNEYLKIDLSSLE